MYNPPHFAETRIDLLQDAIRHSGLAIVVSSGEDGLIASHVPVLLDPSPAPHGTLIGHFARPNPHAKVPQRPAASGETLVIFPGPDAYITPSWYATKRETGKVVPTWNYTAIHAYGPMETFDDPVRLLDVVTRLTDKFEQARAGQGATPWAVSDAPADFVQAHLRGIIGFSIAITRLEGKVKMSQNRPAADRAGVIAGLEADGRSEVADRVRQVAPPPTA